MAGKPAFPKDLEVDDEVKKKQPNKPFKQTKQLIKLALNDGWTQVDIGKACRVTQPVISSWKKGSALAKEHQIQTLLEQYGHILRRKTFKVYWVIDEDTQKSSYVKVEGKVIFSYFLRHVEYYNSGRNKKIKSVMKITIHDQGKGKFRAVLLLPYVTENKEVLSCIDEDGNWVAIIEQQRSSNEVVQWIEDWSKMHESTLPPDAKALPFLIRKALLNHGFPVEDVVDYPASW